MTDFTLLLQDATRTTSIAGVTSFVGEDDSGSFGILAHQARMMTSLVIGLASFRTTDSDWRYVALPGAILYFDNGVLNLCTRRCLIGDDYDHISTALREQLLAEESKLTAMKQSLHRMEEEIFKRLWEMSKKGSWSHAEGA